MVEFDLVAALVAGGVATVVMTAMMTAAASSGMTDMPSMLLAHETNRPANIVGIVDPSVDPGPPGGRALVALGRRVRSSAVDRRALEGAAAIIGLDAAIDAAAVAANVQIMNRVVDATGLPIGRKRREDDAALIATLGLDDFPHAQH